VILVGEIRDFETAEIAIQAALTGTWSLHPTPTTPGAITTRHGRRVVPLLRAGGCPGPAPGPAHSSARHRCRRRRPPPWGERDHPQLCGRGCASAAGPATAGAAGSTSCSRSRRRSAASPIAASPPGRSAATPSRTAWSPCVSTDGRRRRRV
jgi:hypothetical protein